MRRCVALLLLACLLFLTACATIPVSNSSPPPLPSPSTGGGQVGSAVTAKRAQFLLGSLVELTAVAPSDALAEAVLSAGVLEDCLLETVLSTMLECLDLHQVILSAGWAPD